MTSSARRHTLDVHPGTGGDRPMPLFSSTEIEFAETLSRLDYCNPFLPERLETERRALGRDFVGNEPCLNRRPEEDDSIDENVARLLERVSRLVSRVRDRLAAGAAASERERALYKDLALFDIYHRFHQPFRRFIESALEGRATRRVPFFGEFERVTRDRL